MGGDPGPFLTVMSLHSPRIRDGLSPEQMNIPVFVVLYGEANAREMKNLAGLTGSRTFNARDGNLDEAFTEIRGYR